jgi:hypothetical protein
MALDTPAGGARVNFGTTGILRNVAYMACMAWINPDAVGPESTVFEALAGSTGGSRFKLGWGNGGVNGAVRFGGRSSDGEAFRSYDHGVQSVVVGEWQHIAWVASLAEDTVRLFYNGDFLSEGSVPFAAGVTSDTDSNNMAIGARPGGQEGYDGRVFDCRAYGRQLSDGEIQTIYAAGGADGIMDGLHARFPLNDREPGVAAAAGTVNDSASLLGLASTAVTGSIVFDEGLLRVRRAG